MSCTVRVLCVHHANTSLCVLVLCCVPRLRSHSAPAPAMLRPLRNQYPTHRKLSSYMHILNATLRHPITELPGYP